MSCGSDHSPGLGSLIAVIHDAADLERGVRGTLRKSRVSPTSGGVHAHRRADRRDLVGAACDWDADLSVHVLATPERVRDARTHPRAGLEVATGDLTHALERGETVGLKRAGHSAEPIVDQPAVRDHGLQIRCPHDDGASRCSRSSFPSPRGGTSGITESSRVVRNVWPTRAVLVELHGRNSTSRVCGDGASSASSAAVIPSRFDGNAVSRRSAISP